MEDLPGQLVNVVKTGREILDFISPENSFIYSKKTLISHLIIWYMQTGYELLQTKNLVSMYVYLVRLNSLPVLYHLESNFAFFSVHPYLLPLLPSRFFFVCQSRQRFGYSIDLPQGSNRTCRPLLLMLHRLLCQTLATPHRDTPQGGERG